MEEADKASMDRMRRWAEEAQNRYPKTPSFEEQDEATERGISKGIKAALETAQARNMNNPTTGRGGPAVPLPETGMRRKPNKLETYVNFEQINRDLDRLEERMLEGLIPVFRKIRADSINAVQRKFNLNVGYVTDLVSTRGTSKLGPPFQAGVIAAFDDGDASIGRDIPSTRKHATKPNYKPKDALAYLRAKADFFVTGIDAFLTSETKKVLMRAIDIGEPVRDTIRNLQDLYEPFVGDPNVIRDGEQVKPYRLETIVRTNITDAFNRGRIIASERSGDFFIGFEYGAILDMKTTQVCQFLDGYVFPKGDTWLEFLKPPRHYNCRSILVPVMIDTVVDEADYITDEAAGHALELSGEGFTEDNPVRCYGECLTSHLADHAPAAPKPAPVPTTRTYTIEPTKQQAYTGVSKALSNKLDKLKTAEVGENIVLALVRQTDPSAALVSDGKRNNYPIDIISDTQAIEVKTGLVSNTQRARQWRVTLGEPGPAQAALLAKKTPEERAVWTTALMTRAIERKKAFVGMWKQASGAPISVWTYGVLLDPDLAIADVFKFEGFHARIGWESEQAKAAYIGSFRYA